MSWGHSISSDLITWTHLPVAILTGKEVSIFSGSAVLDTNTSGLCLPALPLPCLICIWAGDGLGKQTINLASSLDSSFVKYAKYPLNPVIDINSANFRDPAVFFYTNTGLLLTSPPPSHSLKSPLGHWIVLIAHSDMGRGEFYRSDDLIHWTFLSAFTPSVGQWECPDMLQLEVKETGEMMWVLTTAVEGSTGVYFVGHFNGSHFVAFQDAVTLDWGLDFYAAISYKHAPVNRSVLVGWMSGMAGGYTGSFPTVPWRGSYTIPRTLTLHRLQLNSSYQVYRMHQMPVEELNAYRHSHYSLDHPTTVTSNDAHRDLISSALRYDGGTVIDLEFCMAYPSASLSVGFFLRATANHSEYISVAFNYSSASPDLLTLSLDRRWAGVVDFSSSFPSLHSVSLPLAELRSLAEQLCVRLLLDRISVEVFVQRGWRVVTESVFPSPFIANKRVEMFVGEGKVDVRKLEVWGFDEGERKMEGKME